MQDGAAIPGDDAGEWLKNRFSGQEDPEVRIDWTVSLEPNPAAFRRVLEILFSPQSDSPAA